MLISAAILLGSGLLYFAAAKIIDHKARQWKVCLGAIEAEGFTPKSINDSINRLGTSAAAGTAVAASTTTQSGAAPQLQPRPPAQAGVQTGLKPVTLEQKKRLTEQVKSIERGLQTSCQAGIFYFTSRNATLTVSTAAGILTIASLGFISKQGWDKTNNALINVGITSGLILFTLWTYGQLYSQSKNVENLTTKYITACNLLNTIATSLANSRDQPAELPQLDLNTEEGMARFMRAIDSKLEIIEKPEFLLDDSFAKQSAERFNRLLTTEPPPARPAP